ncbi:MAG: T9SS type A sorting domain-containing protein [Bacteroidaceae bacterium]|nr:T9SS type A sorting domain-containing protein [Bacteroidaceae bacterium]
MRKVLLFLVLCLPTIQNLSAQSVIINETEGSKIELSIDSLRSITFKDGKMVATYDNGAETSYLMSEIGRLDFDSTTDVNMVSAMEGKLTYSPASGIMVIANSQDKTLCIYTLGGTAVLSQKISSPIETIDVSGLEKGIYLLKLDGKTIKIIR